MNVPNDEIVLIVYILILSVNEFGTLQECSKYNIMFCNMQDVVGFVKTVFEIDL